MSDSQTTKEPSEVEIGRDRDAWPDHNPQTTNLEDFWRRYWGWPPSYPRYTTPALTRVWRMPCQTKHIRRSTTAPRPAPPGSQQKFGVRLRPDLRAGLAGMLPSTKANGEFYGLTGETYDVRPDVETTQAKTAAP